MALGGDAGRRTVHLPDLVNQTLADHIEHYRLDDPQHLIFTGPLSEGLRRATFYQEWDKARRTIGLPALHLHDLRTPLALSPPRPAPPPGS